MPTKSPSFVSVSARTTAWIVAGIVLAAALVRVVTSLNDLWLDEIWSLQRVLQAAGPWDLMTKHKHDNNHILYSLCLYALGPGRPDWVYRVPALLCGVGLVAVAGWIGWLSAKKSGARGAEAPACSVISAVLIAFSFLEINYGSEARGFSLALFFGLLAFAVAQRGALAEWSGWAIVYWTSIVLALLSQALAVHALTGLLAWSALRVYRRRAGVREWLGSYAWWNLPPVVFAAAYYVLYLRIMNVGGGEENLVVPEIGKAITMASGLPWSLPASLALAFAAGVLVAGLLLLRKSGSDLWLFYAVAVVVSPALLLSLPGFPFVYARHFIFNATLWLLLGAVCLAWLWARSRAGAAVCSLILIGFVAGNAAPTSRLIREGRGNYRAALRHLVASAAPGLIRVSSDHDFRNQLVINYHAERIGAGGRIVYVPEAQVENPPVDWYFAHRILETGPPPQVLRAPRGSRFGFESRYPAAPPSGWVWYLYRRMP